MPWPTTTRPSRSSPQDATAYNNRGNARQAQGDLAGALADYDQAIALNPTGRHGLQQPGIARAAQGDLAGALADYDQAIVLNPQDATAYNNRGMPAWRKGTWPVRCRLRPGDCADPRGRTSHRPTTTGGFARSDQGTWPVRWPTTTRPLRSSLPGRTATAYHNRGVPPAWIKGTGRSALADFDQAIALFPDGPDKAKAYSNRGNARSEGT